MADEPQTFTRSKDEAVQAAQDWMRLHHGEVLLTNPGWYYSRLGLLVACLTDLHTPRLSVVTPVGGAA